ncbi:MAG: hypothetical protein HQ592_15920, partial [Planctomycetes bacterium]|nr:hypothetical protein [Planctomycetota bacterium]
PNGVVDEVGSLFWFYVPKELSRPCFNRQAGVYVSRKLPIRLKTIVLPTLGAERAKGEPKVLKDVEGAEFARRFNLYLDRLLNKFPALTELRSLYDCAALANAMAELVPENRLSYWVNAHSTRRSHTPEAYDRIVRTKNGTRLQIEGGIELKVVLARLANGEETGFRDAVLKSRPSKDALVWQVPLEQWRLLPSSTGSPGRTSAAKKVSTSDIPKKKVGCSFLRTHTRSGGTEDLISARAALYSPDRRSIAFPKHITQPWGGSVPDIGGVMLAGTASVEGMGPDAVGKGITNMAGGDFSLILNGKDVTLTHRKFREFVTALWAVYYGNHDPGISIDPIERGGERHMVRYIGSVINTDLGEVMREADYVMKKWTVGTETPDIPGFRCVDDLTAIKGMRFFGASRRFWFVPEGMRFRRCGNALLFDGGRMTLKTEYLSLDDKAAKAEPADLEFARFFTRNYGKIAGKYPVFHKLFEYAKLVSLAKYLKESGVPLHGFLMANKHLLLTAKSPGTVAAFRKDSTHWQGVTIEGGVDLVSESSYVIDEEAAEAIRLAVAKLPRRSANAGRTSVGQRVSSLGSKSLSVEIKDETYTITPSRALASTAGGDKIRYQTDAALRHGGEPSIELVRYYDPDLTRPGAFGEGWDILVPYSVEILDSGYRKFLNVRIPNEVCVTEHLTGKKEVLAFSRNVCNAAAYVPDDPTASQNAKLVIMTDGSLRLLDKARREFWFDPALRLTDMMLSRKHRLGFEYEGERVVALTEDGGRKIKLIYKDNRVEAARLPDGREIRYHYQDGKLARVEQPDAGEDIGCGENGGASDGTNIALAPGDHPRSQDQN